MWGMVHYIMQIVNHFYNLNKKKGTVLFLEEKGDGSIFERWRALQNCKKQQCCHSREGRNPVFSIASWIPAFAGMT
jgi:hypothetical protein